MCCVRGRSLTRDRAVTSERQTASSGFSPSSLRTSWRSLGDGSAARDPGAHNHLTVGCNLTSKHQYGARAILGWNVARSFDYEMSRGGSGVRCRRRERGAPCSAASRPSVRSTLRVAAAAWTGFARCYVAVADGGEAVRLPSDRRGRFTPTATSRMCYQRKAMPRLDRQNLIPDSDDSSATSGSISLLSRSALTMVESLFEPNHRMSARTPT